MKITQGLALFAAGLLPLAQATFTGRATFFSLASGPGTCGFTNTNSDLVVALPTGDFASGANCGRNIRVTFGTASVVAQVVEVCAACGSHNIDLSPAAYTVLAPLSTGLINPVSWDFI